MKASVLVDRSHTVMETPVGPITLVADNGTLIGAYMERQRYRPPEETFGDRDADLFTDAIGQLTEYFEGSRTRFDLPLKLMGTEFQRQVWEALLEVEYGETVSYRELAERIGRPTAARAVGLANGKNPISIIVPCHRVLGSSGNLTGYGGGLPRKRYLLDFEQDHRAGQGRKSAGMSACLVPTRPT